MSPRVGDFGINPFAEVFAADPATERLQQAPGFRKKKSFVFVKGDLARAMEKPLPPLPPAEDGETPVAKPKVAVRVVDPRSPGTWGEEVVRSIDEVL